MLKVRQRLFLWWDLFREEAVAPFTDRTAFLQFLAFPPYLYFLLQTKSCSAGVEEIVDAAILIKAFLYAFPIYLIWCALKAACCVHGKEKELGEWVGNQFVFRLARHVKTLIINKGENGQIVMVCVPDHIPPYALVRFEISYNDGHGYLILKNHKNTYISDLGAKPRDVKQTVRLNEKSAIFAEKRIDGSSDPTIAIVSMAYWEK